MGIFLLTLSIAAGQLIKIPLGGGGLSLLDLTVIGFCLWGYTFGKVKFRKPPHWVRAAFIFMAVALISLLFTPIKLTPFEFLISLSYMLRFFLYIFFGYLLYSGAFPSIKENSSSLLTASGILLALTGLVQFIFVPDLRFLVNWGWDPHYFRAASTFLDPNFLGSFLVLTLTLLSQKNAFVKKWQTLAFALTYICLLVTFSRGSYFAFLAAFTTISILSRSFKKMILTIILFSGLLLGFYGYQKSVAEPRGINRSQSAEFRLSTWQQGWQLFLYAPALGVGFNTYRYALRAYHLADDTFLKSHGSSTNDSSLLYVLATTGIIGFLAYLYFLLTLFNFGWKDKILPAGLMGLLAQSFFANTLFFPPLLIWAILTASQKK